MRLYSGMSRNFIEDTVRNQIAGKLEDAFFRHFRYKPSRGEVNSWRNSLRAIAQVFQASDLMDHGVILEYQLPLTSRRLDCLVCGRNDEGSDGAVIVELKQWAKCSPALGERLVTTWVGGAEREVLHPSAQVGQYQLYLEDSHTAFYEGPAPVGLSSCACLHNYFAEPDDTLFLPQFAEITSTWLLLGHGSGHFVITCWHVVTHRDPFTNAQPVVPPRQIEIVAPAPNAISLHDNANEPVWLESLPSDGFLPLIDVVAVPLEGDAAALHTTILRLPSLEHPIHEGTAVDIVGFSSVADPRACTFTAKVTARDADAELGAKRPAFLIRPAPGSGFSGAPVFLRGGASARLIGVYAAHLKDDSDTGLVWKSSALRACFTG